MNRQDIVKYARQYMNDNGLSDWSVVLNTEPGTGYHGLCHYASKTLILSAYSMELLHENDAKDTVRHEVCHALCSVGAGHGSEWVAMAEKHNVRTTLCTKPAIPEHVIDAIRNNKLVEVEFETVQIPKYKVTVLKDKCPICGKIAKERFSTSHIAPNGDTVKLITLECFHIISKVTPKGTAFETMVSNDWKIEVKNCKHDWRKHQCDKCKEFRLMNFQLTGAKALELGLSQQKGFGLFDEMGLGKTVQALSYIKFHEKLATPTLYIVKSAIKFQWFKQIIRWLGPSFAAQTITTSKDPILPGLKSYIISYDLLRRYPREKLEKVGFRLVILDECQQIKNPDSTRTQEVRKIVNNQDIKVIPVSGTPWKNRGAELFPVLNIIDPYKFHTYQHFLDNHVSYYYQGNNRKMGGIRNPKKFREFTSGLLIRREFDEVIEDYPSVNRTKLPVQLDELGQTSYDEATSDFVKWYNDKVISGTEDALNGMEILAKLSRARHITGLAKIPATLGYIEDFVEETEKKITVFVHHNDVAQLMMSALMNTDKKTNPEWYDLAIALKNEGIPVLQLSSSMNDEQRNNTQERFNATQRCVLIASTLACGEGLDLQTCSDAIMHERQWNPMNEDQAAPGRFKRIGQLASIINVIFPEAEGTVDEFLADLNENKRGAFHEVMNTSESKPWNESDFGKTLAKMIIAKYNSKKGVKQLTFAGEILGNERKSLTSQASI